MTDVSQWAMWYAWFANMEMGSFLGVTALAALIL
jgi:hypothetical protein